MAASTARLPLTPTMENNYFGDTNYADKNEVDAVEEVGDDINNSPSYL